MGFGHLTGKFECRDRLPSADRWETLKKFVERISSFKIVVQGFHRNPRAYEDRDAAEMSGSLWTIVEVLGMALVLCLRVYARVPILSG